MLLPFAIPREEERRSEMTKKYTITWNEDVPGEIACIHYTLKLGDPREFDPRKQRGVAGHIEVDGFGVTCYNITVEQD